MQRMCQGVVLLQFFCSQSVMYAVSKNTLRVIWSFLPSLVALKLIGLNAFSTLVILFSVDGVNLQCLLRPFSSVSLTFCARIIII